MSTTPEIMECGHAAQSPGVCVICSCKEVAQEQPDLTGRKAKCHYAHAGRCKYECAKETDSAFTLAFFKHQPEQEYDSYYCGCWGWD